MYTYHSKQVIISLGNHSVSAYAEDSFITIAPKGEGVTSTTGCDGEVARSVDPSNQYVITLTVMQNSPTNAYLEKMCNLDRDSGNGVFSVLVKDLRGKEEFSCKQAWAVKPADWGRAKAQTNRAWTIETADGKKA